MYRCAYKMSTSALAISMHRSRTASEMQAEVGTVHDGDTKRALTGMDYTIQLHEVREKILH